MGHLTGSLALDLSREVAGRSGALLHLVFFGGALSRALRGSWGSLPLSASLLSGNPSGGVPASCPPFPGHHQDHGSLGLASSLPSGRGILFLRASPPSTHYVMGRSVGAWWPHAGLLAATTRLGSCLDSAHPLCLEALRKAR